MPQPGTTSIDIEREKKLKKELNAVCAALSILGLAFSSWASRVPDVRDLAILTAATLGYALLFRGAGTIVMMPIVASGINRFGATKVVLWSGLMVAFTLVPIAMMNNWIALGLLLMLIGAVSSAFNISVNALGAKVEMESGTSHMGKIHSWFGFGNLGGALIGTLMARLDVSVVTHFMGVSILMLVILGMIYRHLPEDAPHPDAEKPKYSLPRGGLIALGIICFLGACIEGSINNWVGLFFTDHLNVSHEFAPIGYTSFAGALLLMRILGDRLKNRFGPKRLLVVGSLSGAVGIVIALYAPNMAVGAIGVFLAGAGASLNFPMVFSAAGREGAIALTSVATLGYVGGMVSQPLVGLIVEQFELFGGFLFIAICMVMTAYVAFRSNLLKG